MMTQLDCTVTNCLYNKDCLCSKGDIIIGGNHAARSSDTCCESFRPGGSAAVNSTGTASTTVDIDCEAIRCIHNADCKCSASHIGIGGGNRAVCRTDTECADFMCK